MKGLNQESAAMSAWSGVYARMCRVCLRHCAPDVAMTPLLQGVGGSVQITPHGRAVLALANVTIDAKDNLPQQICPKCLALLKQSIFFKLSCERSHKKLSKLNRKEKIIEYSMFSHHFPECAEEKPSNSETKPVFIQIPIKYESPVFSESYTLDFVCENESNNSVDTNTDDDIDIFDAEFDSCEKLLNTMSTLVGRKAQLDSVFDESVYDGKMSRFTRTLKYEQKLKKEPKINKYTKKSEEELARDKAIIDEINERKRQLESKKKKINRKTIKRISRATLEQKKQRMEKYNKEVMEKISNKSRLEVIKQRMDRRNKAILERINKRKEEMERKQNDRAVKNSDGALTCHICMKKSSSLSSLKAHLRTHFGPHWICEYCSKGTSTKAQLLNHMRNMHGKEKPLKCDHCDFRTGRTFDMKEHMRKHTGERPFACETCGLTFRRKNIWHQHQLQHGEKRHKCPHCPSTFYQVSHVTQHINNVHERRYVYACQQPGCDATYAKSGTVRKHMMTKHGIPRSQQKRVLRVTVKTSDDPIVPNQS